MLPIRRLFFLIGVLIMTACAVFPEDSIPAASVRTGAVIYRQTLSSSATISGFYTRLTNAIGPTTSPVIVGLRVNGILRSERVSIPVYGAPLNQYTRQNGLIFPPLDVGQEYRIALDAPLALNTGDSVSLEVVSSGAMQSGITAGIQCQGVIPLLDMREPFRQTKSAGPVSRIAWSAPEKVCTGNQVTFDPFCAPQNNSGAVADEDGTLFQFTAFYSVDEQYGGGRGGSIVRIFGFRKLPGNTAWDSLGLIVDPVPDGLAYAGDPFAFRDLDGTPCLAYSTVNGTDGFSNWTLIDGRILKSTTKSFAGPWAKHHALFTGFPRGYNDAGRAICLRIYPRPATGDYVVLWGHGGGDITVRGAVIPNLESTLSADQINAAPNLVRNQEEGGGGFVSGGKGYFSTWQIPQVNDPTSVQRLYEFELADALNPEKWKVVPGSFGFTDGTNAIEDGGTTADAWSLSLVGDTLWSTAVVWSVTNQKNSIVARHAPWASYNGDVFLHGTPRVSAYQETAPVVEYAVGKQCALSCKWTGNGALSYLFLFLSPSARKLYYGGIALEISDKGSRLVAYKVDGQVAVGLTSFSGPVYASGQTYQVKLERDNNILTGWVNGQKLGPVEITDATQLSLLSEAQRFKFYGWQGGLHKIEEAVLADGHVPSSDSSPVTIQTETAMRDTNGQVIRDCLEPHIFKFGNTWYAYGFNVRTAATATTCYSSMDLKEWTLRSTTPWVGGWDAGNLALWYVVYNSKNQEYVGYWETYGRQIQVYTSPLPEGPFTYHNTMTGVYGGPGDLLIYPDTDGKVYLVYNKYQGSIPQRFAYIYQLNDDYYDILPSTLCNTNAVMEGFWMVKHNNNYFLFGSGLVSYDVDDNFYLTAPSPLGPWTNRGYFAPVGSKTFASQTFQGLSVSGSKGTAHVFIGHRWNALGPVNGCFPNASSIWLPLFFNSDTTVEQMKWYDTWQLDTAGAIILPQDNSTLTNFDSEGLSDSQESLSLFPNPTNPSCRIAFTLKGKRRADLSIHDLSGRLIRQIDLGGFNAGAHSVTWDGSGFDGKPAASGVYICKLRDGARILTRKLVLAK